MAGYVRRLSLAERRIWCLQGRWTDTIHFPGVLHPEKPFYCQTSINAIPYLYIRTKAMFACKPSIQAHRYFLRQLHPDQVQPLEAQRQRVAFTILLGFLFNAVPISVAHQWIDCLEYLQARLGCLHWFYLINVAWKCNGNLQFNDERWYPGVPSVGVYIVARVFSIRQRQKTE